jgi:gamma-glutamyltranspeptidase/glutathione hydrolase
MVVFRSLFDISQMHYHGQSGGEEVGGFARIQQITICLNSCKFSYHRNQCSRDPHGLPGIPSLIMSHHSTRYDRRTLLAIASGAVASLAANRVIARPDEKPRGLVVSRSEPAATGMEILDAGGNAVDAAVAAALVGCVVNVSKCGIGGYGGHLTIGRPGGEATSIDFNSTAPAAARPDMFPLDENGAVKGHINERGWLAAGVPGTLAGMQLALEKHGTLSWDRILQPAIRWARDGFPLTETYPFPRDAKPLKKGDVLRNPQLADMLQHLAESGSAEPFYRGPITERIAQSFHKNGGLVTAQDMSEYQAREVMPLTLEWRGHTIATAPLTAGGITVLQAIASLKALDEDGLPQNGPRKNQTWLEALRIAWADRLALLGDPSHVDVPVERLLSEQYAQQSAEKIKRAVAERRPVPVATDGRTAGGTLHVSAVDADGMMVALTLTHGNSFGAQVAVDEFGLILGHGMSRFDPVPGRPNSVAPRKRPLHNMCPTIVFRDGRPVLALGAVGGRRIPNAIFQVLLTVIAEGKSLEEAVRVPRLHTEGGLNVHVEPGAAKADIEQLQQIGYKIQPPLPSFVYAVERQSDQKRPSATIGVADYAADEDKSPAFREPTPRVTRPR